MKFPQTAALTILFVSSYLSAKGQLSDTAQVKLLHYNQGGLKSSGAAYTNELKPDGWVTDIEHLFSLEEKLKLDSIIADFEEKTTIEIAIVSVDTIYTTKENFDAYALALSNKWGVGKKETNNGILIAVSRGLRRIRICNGDGIVKYLNDAETKLMIDDEFIPYFKRNDYFGGTLNGLNKLISALSKVYK